MKRNNTSVHKRRWGETEAQERGRQAGRKTGRQKDRQAVRDRPTENRQKDRHTK